MDALYFPADPLFPDWYRGAPRIGDADDAALRAACVTVETKARGAAADLKSLAAMTIADPAMPCCGVLFVADAIREAVDTITDEGYRAVVGRRDTLALADLVGDRASIQFRRIRR